MTPAPPSHGTYYPHYGLDTDASLRIPCLARAPPPVTVTLDPHPSLKFYHIGIDKHHQILYTSNMVYTERPKSEKRSIYLQIRLSPNEHKRLRNLADHRGFTMSALVRTLINQLIY